MPEPVRSPAKPRPDFLVTLGLLPPVSKEDVEQAYRQLALKVHPDHGGHIDDFRKLQSAYERAKEHVEFRTDKRQWIAARIEKYAEAQRAAVELGAMGAVVEFGEAHWLRRSFGDFADLASNIEEIRYKDSDDADAVIDKMVQERESLRSLQSLDLSRSPVSDSSLLKLRHFPRLVWLNLRGTTAGNGVLELVRNLPAMDQIGLVGTRVGIVTRFKIRRLLAKRRKKRPVPILWHGS